MKGMYPTLAFDQQYPAPVVGLDEVGYGAWAGPVVTAAVWISDNDQMFPFEGIVRDSKQLSPRQRAHLYGQLTKCTGLHWAIGSASADEIDAINVRQATLLAMTRALNQLMQNPLLPNQGTLLVDGTLPLSYPPWQSHGVVKGDNISFHIAAASILAKVYRDTLMQELHEEFPTYGWNTNVGYGTKVHQEGLRCHGPSSCHRKSYAPIAKFF